MAAMNATHGQCARCGDENPYTGIVCSGCGSRLPWAEASTTARRMANNPTALSPAQAKPVQPPVTRPVAVSQPVPMAPQTPIQVFCSHCGSPSGGGSFCARCGQTLAIPAAPTHPPAYLHADQGTFYPNSGMPIQNNVNVVVTQQNNNNNSGWLAALLVMMFATPLGCIMIPVALLVMAFAFQVAPTIIGIVAAVIISRSNLPQDQKNWYMAGAVIGGIVINAILLAAMLPPAPVPVTP